VGDPSLSSSGDRGGGEVHYHYRALRVSGVCARLPPLLQHREAGVRAKVCSLLGNVSKHGDAFYAHMLAAGLLPLLVDGCADADGATRKLACFAVGNAGFHSAVLWVRVRVRVRSGLGLGLGLGLGIGLG